ncbi:hypothetical protein Ssi03_70750 [Sphaerisporangium siamense]|uniref:Uncharacterized protein n=1 Tax=Sphaerisporangium siamense TaxID=795645 RepID=A0A7W7D3X8_9ACTN|nr:hypothetical protein [Sphaerisporangium siamense]MBB4698900.1 hypothetical protein [Sphaerisporangium siamense]GII89085.1 hypothetical protein Ssi03_70750 [Sphaerisporangium siamense]
MAITSDPRKVDARQHPLKGALGAVKIGGETLEQWQYEATAGGRIWYAVDEEHRTLWITWAGAGHSKATERRRS